MPSQLLRQVRVLDPVAEVDCTADVLIRSGAVAVIAPQIAEPPADAQVIDRAGLVLGTGLVDLYSHSGEPGFESRETLHSLFQAAIEGGFTRLTLLPDTHPAIDTLAGLAQVRSRIQPDSVPQIYLWAALTVGVAGKQMTELTELATAGAVGFADGQPLPDTALLRRLLEYAQPLAKPLALWCCDQQLTGNGVMREGIDSIQLGLPGSPTIAETSALAAVLECVEAIGTPVHLMRISTARSVELIRAAKARGLPITASTTWMHLLRHTQDIQSYDPNLRIEPPLGTPDDQAALIAAVQQGVIDAIAVDHSPYTYEEKTVAFAEAPPGAIGLELALPLLWHRFVESGEWSALLLWQALSSRPARCLHQEPATVAPSTAAELILFDPQQSWQVSQPLLKSQSRNTPWLGHTIRGRVIRHWCPAHKQSGAPSVIR
jgi:dihydroorotase